MKKNGPSQTDDPAATAALKLHREIVNDADQLFKKWTALARKCLKFREGQYYKKVMNSKTGKPFKSFAQWAKCVFGKSKSTIFAATRIVRELDGLVPDKDLSDMTKENAETLVEAKNTGEEITPELVEAAKKEPAKELRKRVHKVQRIDEAAQPPNQVVLGPFRVSTETATDFQRAMTLAAEKTTGGEGEVDDLALAFMSRHFLAEMDAKGEQEAAA